MHHSSSEKLPQEATHASYSEKFSRKATQGTKVATMTPRNALASDKAVKPARAKRYVQSNFGASPPRYAIKHKRIVILSKFAKSGLRSTRAKRYAHFHFSDSGPPKGTRSPSHKHQDEGSAQRPQHTNISNTLKFHWIDSTGFLFPQLF